MGETILVKHKIESTAIQRWRWRFLDVQDRGEEGEEEIVKKIQRNKGEHGERRRERDRETKGKKKMIA